MGRARTDEPLPTSTELGGPARKKTRGWLLIVFIVSAWTFALGVLVGRGTAPVRFDIVKLEKELAGLRKELFERKPNEGYKIGSSAVYRESELGFFEALKQPKKDLSLPPPALPAVETPAPKAVPPGAPAPSKSQESERTAKAPKAPEPQEKVGTPEKALPEGRLTIQVAAFRDRQAAGRLAEQLNQKGFAAFRIEETGRGKDIIYRVRVGAYQTRGEAAPLLDRLVKEGFKAYVVNR
jgi:DedD protein